MIRTGQLVHWLVVARSRTFELIGELEEADLRGPRLPHSEIPLWGLGNIIWRADRELLGGVFGQDPVGGPGDDEFASALTGPHRSSTDLPELGSVLRWAAEVQARLLHAVMTPDEVEASIAAQLVEFIAHEDRFGEELIVRRHALARSRPDLSFEDDPDFEDVIEYASGDVVVPGGDTLLGASHDGQPCLASEQWAHPVNLPAFSISQVPVTEVEYSEFVEDGGYRRPALWSSEGWAWLTADGRTMPRFWRRAGRRLERRIFDEWSELGSRKPVAFVNHYEASAYCQWANRRLPSEGQWELAAASGHGTDLGRQREPYPWGSAPPTPDRLNADGRVLDVISVDARAGNDSAWGCRQMLGNVWEWTASPAAFYPEAGSRATPPAEHRVARGGSFATSVRFLRNTSRLFLAPERDDLASGFRTCPTES